MCMCLCKYNYTSQQTKQIVGKKHRKNGHRKNGHRKNGHGKGHRKNGHRKKGHTSEKDKYNVTQ